MLVNKMIEAAQKSEYECEINAYAISAAKEVSEGADILLLGPQVRFRKNEIQELCPDIPVECIDMQAYGTLNGVKVLHMVQEILGD